MRTVKFLEKNKEHNHPLVEQWKSTDGPVGDWPDEFDMIVSHGNELANECEELWYVVKYLETIARATLSDQYVNDIIDEARTHAKEHVKAIEHERGY